MLASLRLVKPRLAYGSVYLAAGQLQACIQPHVGLAQAHACCSTSQQATSSSPACWPTISSEGSFNSEAVQCNSNSSYRAGSTQAGTHHCQHLGGVCRWGSVALVSSSRCWQGLQPSSRCIATTTGCCDSRAHTSSTDSTRPGLSHAAVNSSVTQGSTSSSSSSSSGSTSNLQLPPAVAAGAAAAGAAATNAAKQVAKQASKLVKLVRTTSLSEATWLQLNSIWQSHSTTITALTAAAATAGVYQVVAAAAGHFVDVSDPAVYWSCAATSAAAVAATGLQIRSSFTVDPERVYRITMRKLNRHAGLQEVMGSPLAGSDVRLELVTQGTLFVQETLLPKRRAPRIHLMFQLSGPTKTGVVSVEAKKAFGSKYAFKSLMVELPDKPLTSQAAGAAATAAASKLHSAAGVAHSSQPDSQSSRQQSEPGGGQAAGTKASDPARIYIIGQPAHSSSTRHMSPSALLEDLKDPLLFALKHNLAGYEAEDETEGQLAWSKPQQDPDQTTWWDDTKTASKILACRAYATARKTAAAAVASISRVGAKLRVQAAASSRTAGSSMNKGKGLAAPAASTAATASTNSVRSDSGNAASLSDSSAKPTAASGSETPAVSSSVR